MLNSDLGNILSVGVSATPLNKHNDITPFSIDIPISVTIYI
jgi:hypothetical protein